MQTFRSVTVHEQVLFLPKTLGRTRLYAHVKRLHATLFIERQEDRLCLVTNFIRLPVGGRHHSNDPQDSLTRNLPFAAEP
jgi:hypothetical protein